jgi:hypothetical protein
MPFVPSLSTQLVSEKLVREPQEVTPQEDPTLGEIGKALFRQENMIGSWLVEPEGLPDTKDDPTFDAYSMFTEDERNDKAFVETAIFADNSDELDTVRRQMERERKDRDTIARGGATSFVLALPVAAADLTSMLAFGGLAANTYRAGKSILSSAAVTGSVVGAESAIQEAALHSTQLTRTYSESAVNIGASTLLGGILGVPIQKLANYGIDDKVLSELEDVMNVEPKIAEGINPTINAKTGPVGDDSVGAARTVVGSFEVKGKAPRALLKAMPFDPLSRTSVSEYVGTRRTVNMLAENVMDVDAAPLQSAQSLAGIKIGKVYSSIDNHRKLYAQYRDKGGVVKSEKTETGTRTIYSKNEPVMTSIEFNEAVARAVRTGESDIPEVKASADFWRSELYDPLRDEMIDLNMLPEDVDVSTSVNYLNRIYSKNKISTNLPSFVSKVSKWLQDKDETLYQNAKDAQAKLDAGDIADGERAKLQAIIDKSEFKKGRDFEPEDYESIALDIADRIRGTPDGRLPYDWKMGEGFSSGRNGATLRGSAALRGPLKSRKFTIEDEIIEEFLENDIETLGKRYYQQTAVDIELMRKFNSVTLDDQIKDIQQYYSQKQVATSKRKDLTDKQKEKENLRLSRKSDADIRDIAGIRDRMRGVYGYQEDNIFTRIGRSARDLNYLRLLGGVTISSLPDIARVVMAEGFVKSFSKGLVPLVTNLKQFKLVAEEAKMWGVGTDAFMGGKSSLIADVGDYVQGGTAVERGLRSGAAKFGKINVLDYWTSGIKQVHAVTMQTSIFDNLKKGIYDKRLGRLGIDEQSANDMWEQVKLYGTREGGIWQTGAKNWDRQDLERMWGAAVRKESDRVIIMPGQEKPLFMSSELGKAIGQFRAFTLSSNQRIVIAALQNQDNNTLGGVLALVGMGMFSYYIKQSVAGRPVSTDPATLVMEGIDRSGVLGILGEANLTLEKISGNSVGLRPLLGVSAHASRFVSRSQAESLLGPTFGSLLSTTVAASNALTSKEPMTEADVRTLRRLIPLQNLFYLKHGFDAVEKSIVD